VGYIAAVRHVSRQSAKTLGMSCDGMCSSRSCSLYGLSWCVLFDAGRALFYVLIFFGWVFGKFAGSVSWFEAKVRCFFLQFCFLLEKTGFLILWKNEIFLFFIEEEILVQWDLFFIAVGCCCFFLQKVF
jgi:hypothetical protein